MWFFYSSSWKLTGLLWHETHEVSLVCYVFDCSEVHPPGLEIWVSSCVLGLVNYLVSFLNYFPDSQIFWWNVITMTLIILFQRILYGLLVVLLSWKHDLISWIQFSLTSHRMPEKESLVHWIIASSSGVIVFFHLALSYWCLWSPQVSDIPWLSVHGRLIGLVCMGGECRLAGLSRQGANRHLENS